MKSVYLSLTTIAFILMAFSYPSVDSAKAKEGGIEFHEGSFEEVLQLAEKENKLIFLDIYASWCGPCKRLKSKTFSDSEVGGFYNKEFINVAIDAEKGEGIELARKYGVKSYPTLLFVDFKGEVVLGTVGYHNSSEFLALGKSIIKK